MAVGGGSGVLTFGVGGGGFVSFIATFGAAAFFLVLERFLLRLFFSANLLLFFFFFFCTAFALAELFALDFRLSFFSNPLVRALAIRRTRSCSGFLASFFPARIRKKRFFFFTSTIIIVIFSGLIAPVTRY